MGMFDHIFHSLKCPVTNKIESVEIQIKWREFRQLASYKVGDILDELYPEYNNTWVRAEYGCPCCSHKTKGKFGDYIKTEDQKWHYCFVNIKDHKLIDVKTEEEFNKLNVKDFKIYD